MKHSFGNSRLTRPSHPAPAWGWACLFLLLLAGGLRASDLPDAFTLNLPFPANQATPGWLGHPETPPTEFATLDLPILAPDTNASLLVTVYFQEKEGGFMRITWQGTQGAQVLSDNFYENIGMTNQRSLLISPATLMGDGTLIFQCGDSSLGIQRIKLEWLENKESLVSPKVADLLVAPEIGPTQLVLNLNGVRIPTGPGAWEGQTVTVPLTDEALRIEQGVEFSVELDKMPGTARLALKEAGLPLGRRLVVWINDQRAGTITPAVPDLLDDGFVASADGSTSYAGWRDGSFYVPVSLLKLGVNTLQFSDEDDAAPGGARPSAPASDPPLAVKALVFQFNFPPAPANGGGGQPDSSTPTGPIPPAQSSPTPPETNTP
ncbi:MAG TPA: hypothetical protein VGZ93_11790 [Candidatus Methylacidiphilales bacterium]|jgi:hypothetical protein|nr:hypothetical protein [Candidatus Methylacidiphilales bacterium]